MADLEILPDGRIAAAALAMVADQTPVFRFMLVLFDSDGRRAMANPVVPAPIGPGNDYSRALALQPDGKLLLAGEASSTSTGANFGLVRFHADGSPDTAFGSNAIVTVDFSGSSDAARDVLVQPDGKIVLVGVARNGSSHQLGIARVMP